MAGTSGLVVCRKPQFLSISFSKGSGLPHNLAGGFLWASISGDREGRRERERRERGRERREREGERDWKQNRRKLYPLYDLALEGT